jgi:hypothetical protein
MSSLLAAAAALVLFPVARLFTAALAAAALVVLQLSYLLLHHPLHIAMQLALAVLLVLAVATVALAALRHSPYRVSYLRVTVVLEV